jgi:glycosyltransferase involved in cell wall biosynthesis
MISCVVHTYNSELYLDKVLASLKFCDEIVIVDMHSSDRTLDIARKYNASIFLHENVGYADPARQFGVECCSYDWVLSVDSDEIIPNALGVRLKAIAKAGEYDVVLISRRNFMFGREIHGAGWGYKSDVIPRFFKKGSVYYGHEVHDFINVAEHAKCFRLVSSQYSIVHFNYDSVSQFIGKLDRYTNFEVAKKRRIRSPLLAIAYQFLREFLGRFFLLKGYKDGWLGAYLSLAMAFYRATVIAKQDLPNKNQAIEIYKGLGHEES